MLSSIFSFMLFFPDQYKLFHNKVSSNLLLSNLDGRTGADVNSNNTNVKAKNKRSSIQKKSPLSFFSHKIGIGEGLGLQEYMVYVSDGGEDDLEVWGYKENMTRLLITLTLVAVTGVLPLGLFLYWMEHYWLYCTQEPCVLEEATTVLVVVRTFDVFMLSIYSTIFSGSL